MRNSKSSEQLVLITVLLVRALCVSKFAQSVEIECIPLNTCPTALKLLSLQTSSPEIDEFFKLSFCGFDEKREPMVWCSQLNFCKTPHNFNGTCTPTKNCKVFLKLKAILDPSDLKTQSYLNKFRCNEILKEEHVCCPTENLFGYLDDFDYADENGFLPLYDFSKSPVIQGMEDRFGDLDDDYDNLPYGWASDQPGNYDNHFGNRYPSKNNFHESTPMPKDTHSSMWHHNAHGIRNRWDSHAFTNDNLDPYHRRNTDTLRHNRTPDFGHKLDSPDYGHWGHGNFNNERVNHEFGNNNKHGTSHGESSYHITEGEFWDPFHHKPSERDPDIHKHTTPSTRQLHNTPNGRDLTSSASTSVDSNEIYTPKTRDWTTVTISSNRRTTNIEDFERTTPKSRHTTPSNKQTTYDNMGQSTSKVGPSNMDSGVIVFEDSSETTEKQLLNSTDRTTERNYVVVDTNDEGRDCETPDRKAGVCIKESTCQSYQNLQKNLDRSKNSVPEYLSKFRCNSTYTREIYVCCQSDEENSIDNSVFNLERTHEGVPEPYSKICGRQTANTDRIVGGTLANLGEFPWIALLRYPTNRGIIDGCGGTLISSRYVLTAAHCVDEAILRSKGLGKLREVILGEYDTRNKTDCIYMQYGEDCAEPPRTFGVESIVTHNSYSTDSARNDIALIRLSQEVTFTDYIKPICLPTKTSTLKGNETFVIAGWGKTFTEKSSPVLRKAKVPFSEKQNCNTLNTNNRVLIDGQICVGRGNGTDSCKGDSGGPVMLEVNFNFELVTHLVAIVSYGFGECGTAPSVNTYVPFYVDWINANMK